MTKCIYIVVYICVLKSKVVVVNMQATSTRRRVEKQRVRSESTTPVAIYVLSY